MGWTCKNLQPFHRRELVIAFILLLPATRFLAQSSASDEASRILSLETIWNQAEQQQDTQALEKLLGQDFIYVDVDGSIQTRQEFLEGIKNRPEHIDVIGVEPGSVKAYLYGNSAVASGIYREKGTLHGKAYSKRGRFTDTWIKQGSGWVCVASQSTLMQK